ncbi:dihydrodiol dehydrogenase [Egicoccus sp. AB-alg2]|uniref:dihydrodiol dehydrogenase n=1 Tax=Egicoccus sp. AB-alg2 TaxID=3242693 RepID=UPI00359F01F7
MPTPWDSLAGGEDLQARSRDGQDYLVMRNEFATVWLALDRTPNGVRLVVTDADARTSIALDPLELEAISRMRHEDFDVRILERGSGPEPTA